MAESKTLRLHVSFSTNGPFCDVIHYQRKFFVFFIEKTHINQNSRIIFIDYAESTKYAKFMKKYIDLKRAKLSFQ